MERNTEAALRWIVGILEKHKIKYRISGGFAARIYGSERDLADIDIGMQENHFSEILPEIEKYFTHKPAIYKDSEWDMVGSTLNYQGQEMDLYPIDALKFFNKKENKWEDLKHTFADIVTKEIYGIKVPIISKQNLIEYKNKLGRKVDIEDVKQMQEKN